MIPHCVVRTGAIDGERVTLTGEDARHLATVIRIRYGDEISVADTDAGMRYRCSIESVGETVTAKILERIEKEGQIQPIEMTLCQAIPKGRKMDGVIRMCAELGVSRTIPFLSKRSDVKLHDGEETVARRLDRWNAIAHAAAKQSRAGRIMRVEAPLHLSELQAASELNLLFWEEEARSLKTILEGRPIPASITMVIGPEGGLTQEEVTLLESKGFVTASLGASILRTESAPVVAVAQTRYHFSS